MPRLKGFGAVLGDYQIVTNTPSHIQTKEKYKANPDCPDCGGIGWIHPLDELGNVVYSLREPCKAKGCLADSYKAYKQHPDQMQSHGVVQMQTFDNFLLRPGSRDAYKAAQALADGTAKYIWLLIYGGTGNGKTHLCYAITKMLIERGMNSAEMVASAELFSKLRKGVETKEDVLQFYKDVPALIIDDWGVGYGTNFEEARFDELMAYRYEHFMVTVLTTNKELKDLPERVRSRFEDKLRSLIVLNKSGDYRKVAR